MILHSRPCGSRPRPGAPRSDSLDIAIDGLSKNRLERPAVLSLHLEVLTSGMTNCNHYLQSCAADRITHFIATLVNATPSRVLRRDPAPYTPVLGGKTVPLSVEGVVFFLFLYIFQWRRQVRPARLSTATVGASRGTLAAHYAARCFTRARIASPRSRSTRLRS